MTAQNLITFYSENSHRLKTPKEIRTFLIEFRQLSHRSLLIEDNKNDFSAIEKLIDNCNNIISKTY